MPKPSVRIEWRGDTPAVMAANTIVYGRRMVEELERVLTNRAKDVQDAMKRGHPWMNRTGAAERGLFARVEVEKAGAVGRLIGRNVIDLVAGHTVFYGAALETMQGGRFAVVGPTLGRYAPIIMSDIRGVLGNG